VHQVGYLLELYRDARSPEYRVVRQVSYLLELHRDARSPEYRIS